MDNNHEENKHAGAQSRAGEAGANLTDVLAVSRKCKCAGCIGNCAGHNCEICCGYACSADEYQNEVQAAAGGITQTPL